MAPTQAAAVMTVLPSTAVIHLIKPCRTTPATTPALSAVEVAVCGHKHVVVVTIDGIADGAPQPTIAPVWRLPLLNDLVVEADWVQPAGGVASQHPDLVLVYAHNCVEIWSVTPLPPPFTPPPSLSL
jgi:hypothetical protein